jgi:hypothetical protein
LWINKRAGVVGGYILDAAGKTQAVKVRLFEVGARFVAWTEFVTGKS